MTRTSFSKAAAGYRVIDINKLDAETQERYFQQSYEIFQRRNPDACDPVNHPEWVEDFEKQRGTDGFFHVLVNSEDKVMGMAAGVVLPESKTAITTYMYFGFRRNAFVPAQQMFLQETNDRLFEGGAQAVFKELYAPDADQEDADRWERALSLSLPGMVKAPIRDYAQPVDASEEGQIEGMEAYFVFAPDVATDQQKSDIAYAHFRAFTKLYDENIEVLTNQGNLKHYFEELHARSWPQPTIGEEKPSVDYN